MYDKCSAKHEGILNYHKPLVATYIARFSSNLANGLKNGYSWTKFR